MCAPTVRRPLGRRAGGRVPGPEPGAVRGGHRAGRPAPATASRWATTSSPSSPGPAPTRRSWAGSGTTSASPSPSSSTSSAAARARSSTRRGAWSPTIPACSRSGSRRPATRDHCVAAHMFADESCEAAVRGRRPAARPGGVGPRLGRIRSAVPFHRIGQGARDPADRSRHPLSHGARARR